MPKICKLAVLWMATAGFAWAIGENHVQNWWKDRTVEAGCPDCAAILKQIQGIAPSVDRKRDAWSRAVNRPWNSPGWSAQAHKAQQEYWKEWRKIYGDSGGGGLAHKLWECEQACREKKRRHEEEERKMKEEMERRKQELEKQRLKFQRQQEEFTGRQEELRAANAERMERVRMENERRYAEIRANTEAFNQQVQDSVRVLQDSAARIAEDANRRIDSIRAEFADLRSRLAEKSRQIDSDILAEWDAVDGKGKSSRGQGPSTAVLNEKIAAQKAAAVRAEQAALNSQRLAEATQDLGDKFVTATTSLPRIIMGELKESLPAISLPAIFSEQSFSDAGFFSSEGVGKLASEAAGTFLKEQGGSAYELFGSLSKSLLSRTEKTMEAATEAMEAVMEMADAISSSESAADYLGEKGVSAIQAGTKIWAGNVQKAVDDFYWRVAPEAKMTGDYLSGVLEKDPDKAAGALTRGFDEMVYNPVQAYIEKMSQEAGSARPPASQGGENYRPGGIPVMVASSPVSLDNPGPVKLDLEHDAFRAPSRQQKGMDEPRFDFSTGEEAEANALIRRWQHYARAVDVDEVRLPLAESPENGQSGSSPSAAASGATTPRHFLRESAYQYATEYMRAQQSAEHLHREHQRFEGALRVAPRSGKASAKTQDLSNQLRAEWEKEQKKADELETQAAWARQWLGAEGGVEAWRQMKDREQELRGKEDALLDEIEALGKRSMNLREASPGLSGAINSRLAELRQTLDEVKSARLRLHGHLKVRENEAASLENWLRAH